MRDCIFCRILAGELPASVVYADAQVTAFMDIQPVNTGHVLVIPNEHLDRLAALPARLGGQMFGVAQNVAAALRASGVRCDGVNLFLADGEAAGQDVFHAHLHVLPRYAGDGFGLRFGEHYHTPPPRTVLDETAHAIRAAL